MGTKTSNWMFVERVSKEGKKYRTYLKDGLGNKIPIGTPDAEVKKLLDLKKDKTARQGKWAYENRVSKDGKPYRFYLKDADGNRIPIGTDPEAIKKITASKKPKRAAAWLYHVTTTASGKKYQTFLKDGAGNRIPADTPPEKVKELLALVKPKATRVGKPLAAKKTPAQRANRKKLKRMIPEFITNKWLADMACGKTLKYTSQDKDDIYAVLLHNGDWLLIHMQKKNKDRWFFYNPKTEQGVEFDKDIHKVGKGDHNVVWPDGLAPLPNLSGATDENASELDPLEQDAETDASMLRI